MTAVLDPLRAASATRGDDIRWSATVVSASGDVVDAVDADVVLPTASIGKVFLLLTVLDGVDRGTIDPNEVLSVDDRDRVADSGLLQHLDRQDTPVLDLCRFVGAVSDNLATNVLLRRVGLDSVASVTGALGVTDSALHDYVRDERGPGDAPCLSSGCASELAGVVRRIALGHAITPGVSSAVADVLRLNTDLSMVAGAFGLDPLAHVDADLGVRLWNKTGTQTGTRADIGWVTSTPRGSGLAYAVVARFDESPGTRHAVLDAMRAIGVGIQRLLETGR